MSKDSDEKYLTFSLGTKEYGVDIVKVREIIGYADVTPVPRAEEYMKGVIDLRGKIVPIIDLPQLLGLTSVETTDNTCVVIVELDQTETSHIQVGLVVDAMQEVRKISADVVESAPQIGDPSKSAVIRGFAKLESGIVILLNVDLLLPNGATADLAEMARGAAMLVD